METRETFVREKGNKRRLRPSTCTVCYALLVAQPFTPSPKCQPNPSLCGKPSFNSGPFVLVGLGLRDTFPLQNSTKLLLFPLLCNTLMSVTCSLFTWKTEFYQIAVFFLIEQPILPGASYTLFPTVLSFPVNVGP